MGIPARLLSDDEHVVVDVRPHGKSLVRPAIVLVLTAGVASYAAAVLPALLPAVPWLPFAVAGVATVIAARWAVWPFLGWLATSYVVTTRRIVIRSGIVSRFGRDMPLSRINDVYFEKTLVERLLGCGTLVVESAGENGQFVLAGVPSVEIVQREVYRLHEDERRSSEHTPDRPAW